MIGYQKIYILLILKNKFLLKMRVVYLYIHTHFISQIGAIFTEKKCHICFNITFRSTRTTQTANIQGTVLFHT